MLTYGGLDKDPRPNRQIRWLNKLYDVYGAGIRPSGNEARFFPLKKIAIRSQVFRLPLLKIGLYNTFYWDKYKKLFVSSVKDIKFDIIIAHEIRLVPLALRIGQSATVLLDAHEYSPENFSDQFLWRFFFKKYYIWLCEKYLRSCGAVVTPSRGVSNEYQKQFGIRSQVITNASDYRHLAPSKVNKGKIRIIHHGNASASRNLELMIKVMDFLDDRYLLDLMLVRNRSNKRYFNKLNQIVQKKVNVRIISPVEFMEIVPFINKYDIGFIFRSSVNLNLKFGLGNKFFEFIQARLMLAVGPIPEMAKIVKEYDLGLVSKDFNPRTMANSIRSMSVEDILYHKNQSHKYAKELSSEKNKVKFRNIVAELVGNQRC